MCGCYILADVFPAPSLLAYQVCSTPRVLLPKDVPLVYQLLLSGLTCNVPPLPPLAVAVTLVSSAAVVTVAITNVSGATKGSTDRVIVHVASV